ncbi:MAG: hypothetical protein LBF01_02100, partial [Bacteroidales bacterium]|nr:hypothetical protein [Bacteroidales bacterium]
LLEPKLKNDFPSEKYEHLDREVKKKDPWPYKKSWKLIGVRIPVIKKTQPNSSIVVCVQYDREYYDDGKFFCAASEGDGKHAEAINEWFRDNGWDEDDIAFRKCVSLDEAYALFVETAREIEERFSK